MNALPAAALGRGAGAPQGRRGVAARAAQQQREQQQREHQQRPRRSSTGAQDWQQALPPPPSATVRRRRAAFAPDRQFVKPARPAREAAQQLPPPPPPAQQPPRPPPPLAPDPAADDLDALAAAAAAVAAGGGGSWGRRGGGGRAPPPLAGAAPVPLPGAPAAPRYAAADKLQLTREEAADVARRLRRAGPPRPGRPVLRVFRVGIDDLRLFKALELAGLEGRVVVVDSAGFSDAVLAARTKRTGAAVDLGAARRAAAAAGVPLVALRAVSPQRLLEGLGPLLGLREPGGTGGGGEPGGAAGGELAPLVGAARARRAAPRLLRWDEAEGDGSEELLALLYGAPRPGDAPGAGPRWRAWRAAQARGGGWADAALAQVRGADVEDARARLVPANPTARAGARDALPARPPPRRGARVRRRRLRRDLARARAPW
ncbi:hypothetical protein HT031_000716 [Scenedesmus sp. PABB004]|nr:hypothetical protein HT031_000716 [Scenedesmus sp. PABB004]